MKTKLIKLFQPYVSPLARKMVQKTLLTSWIGEGPVVKQFEYEFGQKFHLKNVVAVNSGTSALELAYNLAGLKAGDEIITPVLTYVATNVPLVHLGVKIVFADINQDLNININDVKRKITSKTKAILFVHLGGNNRGLKNLLKLIKERRIVLIEDAAQAVGSKYWGKADFACVSLQACKTLTSGDGGFLICKNKNNAKQARKLRWMGFDADKKHKKEDVDLKEMGYRYQMNDVTASIGLGNLRSLDPVLSHRKRIGQIYNQYGLFAHSWLAGGFTKNYKKLKEKYVKQGIEIGRNHFRNDKYTIFGKFKSKCPIMDELEDKYFFVPNHYGVSEKTAHKIGKIYTADTR